VGFRSNLSAGSPEKVMFQKIAFLGSTSYVVFLKANTIGSPFFSEFSSVPYRTVSYRNRPSIVLENSEKRHFLSKRLAFLALIFPIARSVP
jgi:hypothetical protein